MKDYYFNEVLNKIKVKKKNVTLIILRKKDAQEKLKEKKR